MNVAYFDCFSGAGGDMIVGALLDAGADVHRLRSGLESLGLSGYALTCKRANKQGFAATRFEVALLDTESQPHRHLSDVIEIIERGRLSNRVKRSAICVFKRLAEAEATVHGCPIEQVHFHEVGAVDAILDVVGAVLALELLGVDRVAASPLPTGSGTVECAHGVMPVPAPATAELLKDIPIAATDEVGEMLTPTAAAILTTLGGEFGPLPEMRLDSIGYGAGTRENKRTPNLLRVLLGRVTDDGETDEIVVLETNLDDTSGMLIGHCTQRLLEAGALDVYTVPIQMKKSRPGVLLTVLCTVANVSEMEQIVFAETPTFGVRRWTVRRSKLLRRHERVDTRFGTLRIKIGELGQTATASPEFEDCRRLAVEHQVPLAEVINAARIAWEQRLGRAGTRS